MWSNANLGDGANDMLAMYVKSYLNKLWQTLFGKMQWHRWWWWWRRRLMTTPACVRQQIVRQLLINGKIWASPKMNGLHVVAFNAFTSYDIWFSWCRSFFISAGNLKSSARRSTLECVLKQFPNDFFLVTELACRFVSKIHEKTIRR